MRVDGILYDLSEEITLEKNKKHTIELVVDRLVLRGDLTRRLTDSVETALEHGGGLVVIQQPDTGEETLFSRNYACDECGISMPELSPRMFSFNNPMGACPECSGLGFLLKVDPAIIIPDPSLSIYDGGIQASGWGNIRSDSIARMYFDALSQKYHFDLHAPISSLSKEAMDVILYGTRGEKLTLHYDRGSSRGTLEQAFEGIIPNIERRVRMQKSGAETLYFYTEKHRMENGEKWDTERPISQKQYEKYLLERDTALSPVRKTKYRFVFADRRCEIDMYPFSAERAVLFQYGQSSAALPEEITVLREVTGDADYKNRKWRLQKL